MTHDESTPIRTADSASRAIERPNRLNEFSTGCDVFGWQGVPAFPLVAPRIPKSLRDKHAGMPGSSGNSLPNAWDNIASGLTCGNRRSN